MSRSFEHDCGYRLVAHVLVAGLAVVFAATMAVGQEGPGSVGRFPEEQRRALTAERISSLLVSVESKDRAFPARAVLEASLDADIDPNTRAYLVATAARRADPEVLGRLIDGLVAIASAPPSRNPGWARGVEIDELAYRMFEEKPLEAFFDVVPECKWDQLRAETRKRSLQFMLLDSQSGDLRANSILMRLSREPDKQFVSELALESLERGRAANDEAALVAGSLVTRDADVASLVSMAEKHVRDGDFAGRQPRLIWALAGSESKEAASALVRIQRELVGSKRFESIDQRWVVAYLDTSSQAREFLDAAGNREALLDFSMNSRGRVVRPIQVLALERAIDAGAAPEHARARLEELWRKAQSSEEFQQLGHEDRVEMLSRRIELFGRVASDLGMTEFPGSRQSIHGRYCGCQR